MLGHRSEPRGRDSHTTDTCICLCLRTCAAARLLRWRWLPAALPPAAAALLVTAACAGCLRLPGTLPVLTEGQRCAQLTPPQSAGWCAEMPQADGLGTCVGWEELWNSETQCGGFVLACWLMHQSVPATPRTKGSWRLPEQLLHIPTSPYLHCLLLHLLQPLLQACSCCLLLLQLVL